MIDTTESLLRTDRRLTVGTLGLGLGANAVLGPFVLDVTATGPPTRC
jgi:hypothetical protein